MTYEEKVKLFKAKRYSMPMLPEGTKNWITRDYIRYIDQSGRWYPQSARNNDLIPNQFHRCRSIPKAPVKPYHFIQKEKK